MPKEHDRKILNQNGQPTSGSPSPWGKIKSKTKALAIGCAAVLAVIAGIVANIEKIDSFLGHPIYKLRHSSGSWGILGSGGGSWGDLGVGPR